MDNNFLNAMNQTAQKLGVKTPGLTAGVNPNAFQVAPSPTPTGQSSIAGSMGTAAVTPTATPQLGSPASSAPAGLIDPGQSLVNPTPGTSPGGDKSILGFLGNTFKSAAGFAGSIGNMVIHPINTAENLGGALVGAAEKLIPGTQQDEAKFDSILNFYKDRYGGVKNLENTLYTDPIGVLADLSIFLGGAGGGLKALGKIGEIAGAGDAASIASKIGETASVASKTVDPLNAAVGIAGKTGGLLGKATAGVTGLTTGSGGEAINTAYQAGKEGGDAQAALTGAMRGRSSGEAIRTEAVQGLKQMNLEKTQAYQDQLSKLSDKSSVTGTANADIKSVRDTFGKLMGKDGFNVKPAYDGEGEVIRGKNDFSESTITDGSTNVQKAINLYKDYAQGNQTTVKDLDTLQQKLNQLRPEGRGPAQTFIDTLKKSISDTAKGQFEGYRSMKAGYAEKQGVIDEIQSNLSLGNNSNIDTGIRKLTGVLRENNEFRHALMQELESNTGKNLTEKVAGLALNKGTPRGLVGKVTASLEGGAGLHALLTGGNPLAYIPYLAMSSPRLVGEAANILGMTARQAAKLHGVVDLIRSNGKILNAVRQVNNNKNNE